MLPDSLFLAADSEPASAPETAARDELDSPALPDRSEWRKQLLASPSVAVEHDVMTVIQYKQ